MSDCPSPATSSDFYEIAGRRYFKRNGLAWLVLIRSSRRLQSQPDQPGLGALIYVHPGRCDRAHGLAQAAHLTQPSLEQLAELVRILGDSGDYHQCIVLVDDRGWIAGLMHTVDDRRVFLFDEPVAPHPGPGRT